MNPPELTTREQAIAFLEANCPLEGIARESYMKKVNAEADSEKLIQHAKFIQEHCQ